MMPVMEIPFLIEENSEFWHIIHFHVIYQTITGTLYQHQEEDDYVTWIIVLQSTCYAYKMIPDYTT